MRSRTRRIAIQVHVVPPDPDLGLILPGAGFADAYGIVVDDPGLDSRRAAGRMLERPPRWVAMLMALRDRVVSPFGLKTGRDIADSRSIGPFPIVSETPRRLVAGFDDRHLDFRVVVDVSPAGAARRVTATTIVRTHNRLGRYYLAAILPFHRLIVRALLKQVGD